MDSSTLATSSSFYPSHKPTPIQFHPFNLTPLPLTSTKSPSKISITTNSSLFNNFNPLYNNNNVSNLSHRWGMKRVDVRSFASGPNLNPLDNNSNNQHPFAQTLKTTTKTLVLTLATTLMTLKFKDMPLKAEPLTPKVEDLTFEEDKVDNLSENLSGSGSKTAPLTQLMESSDEFVSNLKLVLEKKLENGEDEEALKILGKLVEAQPLQLEWKFLMARLLNEMGKTQEARDVFEEILDVNPLSFEALFENALIMDRCGEGNAVISRLEKALRIAEDENKTKEARDVRLIMAQIQFLQKNVDEALENYEVLAKEDPKDFRPYFCKGMIYSLLDRNAEAKEQFAKYRELSPKKFEVEGYLRTPLSRMKLFGNDS